MEEVYRVVTPALTEDTHGFLHSACVANCAVTLGPRICTCYTAKSIQHRQRENAASASMDALSPSFLRKSPQLALTLPEMDVDGLEEELPPSPASRAHVEDYRTVVEELRFLQKQFAALQQRHQEQAAELAELRIREEATTARHNENVAQLTESYNNQLAALRTELELEHEERVSDLTAEIDMLKPLAENYLVLQARIDQEQAALRASQSISAPVLSENAKDSAVVPAAAAKSSSLAGKLTRKLSKKASQELLSIKKRLSKDRGEPTA